MKAGERVYLIVISALTSSAGPAQDPVFFVEDFCACSEEGGTIQCGIPFTPMWSVLQPKPEGLEVRGATQADWVAMCWVGQPQEPTSIYSDFSVRVRVRKGLRVGGIGIVTRYTSTDDSYNAELETDGRLYVYRGGGGQYLMGQAWTSLNAVDEDVVLQVDQVGQRMALWAWSPTVARTDAAQCAGTGDRTVSPGQLGFGTWRPWDYPKPDPSVWRHVMVFPTGEEPFLRGDANADGSVDIADAVRILFFLFTGDEGIPCLDAADNDDSGTVDISDPIYILGYLFLRGPAVDAPFGPMATCGVDPTPLDGLSCLRYRPCESYERRCDTSTAAAGGGGTPANR